MRLIAVSVLFLLTPLLAVSQITKNTYICPPCPVHDTLTFDHDGVCPVCGMNLIQKRGSSDINKIDLHTGSGNFIVDGGSSNNDKMITVFYHKPKNFSEQSPVMMVIPGAGRNGHDYRDVWVEASEEYGILILSLHYPEKYYPEFWSYNLGGMISEVEINDERTAILSYEINNDPEVWIWNDFDRIFSKVKNELQFETETYDMFGHSAGGQILHRMTLFNPDNNAGRILASNSGWYTTPSTDDKFPYGLNGITTTDEQFVKAFKANLKVFLGEADNENETRGHLVRSPETDKQGTHRLARGKYFHNKFKLYADSLKTDFNWELIIIPDVGHDYKRMSKAAAKYLYALN